MEEGDRSMAEGHMIVYWARKIRALEGETLTQVDLPSTKAEWVEVLEGRTLERVDTHGKNLLLRISGDLTIRCHALMYGSWQVGEPQMKLRKPEKQVRLRLRTDDNEAVFYNGPVVDIMSDEELAEYEPVASLGPDVMKDDFNRDEAWRRLQRHTEMEIGPALLDQRVVAGIGNIFKSEALFVAGIDPRREMGYLSREDIERIWDAVIPMMWASVEDGGPIATTGEELQADGRNLYVYRQTNRPCVSRPDGTECEGTVEQFRQGKNERTTYWCPVCQQ